MQIIDGHTIISASDLNNFVACKHLLALNMARAEGRLEAEQSNSETGDLLARKGIEHETAYLAGLKAEGRHVVEIPYPGDSTPAALEKSAQLTREAMGPGPDVVFQATFFDGVSRGHADFLFKVEDPSDLGGFSYEVADTKLAKHSKPYFLIQLCFYSELLEKVEGGSPPAYIHVVLGTGEMQSYRLSDFSAYFRQIRRSFDRELEAGIPYTYPYPVAHCEICSWKDACEARWKTDDHLSLVAGIQRRQVEFLEAEGITTLAGLAQTKNEVEGIRPETLLKLRSQAALQLEGRGGHPRWELLPPEDGGGFERLPTPSEGDLFFDFEGDPLYGERGLEYLFGYVTVDEDEPTFEALWGRDYAEEKSAFEQFVDFVNARRTKYPDLHIYHYASYEVTAIKRLAGWHATRELEVDQLLRDKVFVDLYKVVKESMRISRPSYSIKEVETFYREARETEVSEGGASIIKFEEWLETGDDSILEAIAEYNEDDCVSTFECRDWLLERRGEAEKQFGRTFDWFDPAPGEVPESTQELHEENASLREALTESLPDAESGWSSDQHASWLMAQLIDYHQREARPEWWAYFDRQDTIDPEAFVEDPDCIGGLRRDEAVAPRPDAQSLVYRMLFPSQETKASTGTGTSIDPATGESAGNVIAIDTVGGWLDLKRGPKVDARPIPRSLVPKGPIETTKQRIALRVLASDIATQGLESRERLTAGRDILRAARPQIKGREEGHPVVADSTDLDQLLDAVAGLDRSCLFIQGPPGSGKTFSGARLIVGLIESGKKVGVTANSHKAINNLLEETEEAAEEKSTRFKGLKIADGDNAFQSKLTTPMITNGGHEGANEAGINMTAGTAWHYCRDDVEMVDYLFVDEAGQISLADALAMSTKAHNVVLLGDPQQLPQVAQARHPEGSGVSVLEHLLGEHQTIPNDRGVFLDKTWRLHPAVTEFISELMYDGRLESESTLDRQNIRASGSLSGVGLRWLPVETQGMSQSSPEEAGVISAAIEGLLSGSAVCTDADGLDRRLVPEDILVVSPYNAQVRCLRNALPDGIRVGTVDRFQGQEGQIVFFSMATSSGEEMPRNLEFLFSRNRLNVAVSRARCMAVLVASPRLLEIEARTVEQMKLVNSLCRFVEVAKDQASG